MPRTARKPRRRTAKAFGWVPDVPDHRDYTFAAAPQTLKKLPARTDLRKKCPPVYDQGALGSCTANAIGAAFQFDLTKERKKAFVPSRLFIYYNERELEHTVDVDAGAMIRDGIRSVAKKGDCPETEWPYDIAKFADKPPVSCYRDAKRHKAVLYQRLSNDLTQMKGCLASGYPFVFGFSVYQSFMSSKVAMTGHAALPLPGEPGAGPDGQPAGHAVLAVGYDDANQWFIVRNSWGIGWGIKGYFTLPYAYLTQASLADDLWTIRVVK